MENKAIQIEPKAATEMQSWQIFMIEYHLNIDNM